MKYPLFFFLSLFTSVISACPGMADLQGFLVNGNLAGVKEAKKCGLDMHHKSDIALNIAISKKHVALEKYLKSIGLKENARYIRSRWFAEYYSSKSLTDTAKMYFMKTYKPLKPATWQKQLTAFLEEQKEGRIRLTDTWGHAYVMHREPEASAAFVVFCSLGRDGKPGGTNYDRDVCSNENMGKLRKDLAGISSF